MKLGHHAMTWDGYWKNNEIPYDADRLLAEVKAAGYDAIEMGGDADKHGPASGLAKKAADHGLEIAAWGTVVTANPWPPNTEQYRREMDYAAELGVHTIAVCGGFLGRKFRTTFDSDYAMFGDNMRSAIEYGRRHGHAVTFHPHCGCIVETSEEVDRLLEHVPELDLLVDTGHLIAVGSDPVALIRKHPGKIKHVHLKDWDPEENVFMEIGHGSAGLDFAAILGALDEIGYAGDLIVERDGTPIPAPESARLSYEHLAPIMARA